MMVSGYFDKDVVSRPGAGGGKNRPQRVGDSIRNELGLLLISKSKDPRLQNVSILHVGMSKDLRKATVYYSVFGDDEQVRKAAAGLESAKGFIRSHIGKELSLRVVPQFDFKHDLTLVRQEEMERLFKELENDDDASGTV